MSNLFNTDKSPLLSIVILVPLVVITTGIVQLILILLGQGIGFDFIDIISSLDVDNPDQGHQFFIMVVQLLTSATGFILIPMLFTSVYLKAPASLLFPKFDGDFRPLILLIGATICFMIVNSVFIEWNMNVQFPENFHEWAKSKEAEVKKVTDYLTVFTSPAYFILGFITIAVGAAVGEELLFRGIIQNLCLKLFGNIHVAIWLSAFLFSAIHMQFFGFVPRMLLGAFFGYVFYFSGNLSYAITAHFINNGLTLIMLYMYQKEIIPYDIENTDSVPLESVGIFLIIGVVLFWYFIRLFKNTSTTQE